MGLRGGLELLQVIQQLGGKVRGKAQEVNPESTVSHASVGGPGAQATFCLLPRYVNRNHIGQTSHWQTSHWLLFLLRGF